MNSLSAGIRETFGICDSRTGRIYLDIQSYHLWVGWIPSPEIPELPRGFLHHQNIEYRIHMDAKLRRELRQVGKAHVIISYQIRTDGNFAMIRLFEKNRAKKTEGVTE